MLPPAADDWTLREAAHLLNRAGFGGSPQEIAAFHKLGRSRAVASLFSPERPDFLPPPAWAREPLASEILGAQMKIIREYRKLKRGDATALPEEQIRALRKREQGINRQRGHEAGDWWFRRILHTRAPLVEKMTLFWHDHFATSLRKVRQPLLLVRQNELFRRHALGNFRELTGKVLLDPAMLLYLDGQNSKRGKPNENFAREILELFTLGEGSYSEQDIRETARALTGYQVARETGTAFHRRRLWDPSEKTIFGKTGDFAAEDVLSLIFARPQAASFIVRKLWEYFVAENPPEAIITPLAAAFRASGFAIAPLLRGIFLSREFYAPEIIRSRIKSPVEYLAALLKQLEISDPPTAFVRTGQDQLGQILFTPPNVAGWDWGKAWINTNTLLTRYNLAGYITKGTDTPLPGTGKNRMRPGKPAAGNGWKGPDYAKIAPRLLRKNPAELVDRLVSRFFQAPVPEKARESFISYAVSKQGVVFTDREVAELSHLILSTPWYQLC